MNHKERMLAGLPYLCDQDGLKEEQDATKFKIWNYNRLDPRDKQQRNALIRDIIGSYKEHLTFLPPFYCDYGSNIHVGENFMCNYHCVMLDVAPITIGDNVLFGPNVSIITAGHPIHPVARNSGYEYGKAIHIKDNVWIGCGAIVNPGVTIGKNVVIGSGSVVTHDIPDNVVAAGNPCKILREITEEERKYFFKKEPFDLLDYETQCS